MTAKSEWKKAGVIVAIIGLILSLLTNIAQFYQNHVANSRADAEATRADRQEFRAKELEKKKDQWDAELKSRLRTTDREMNADSADLDKQYALLKSINYQTGQDAEDAIENDKKDLAELERKRIEISDELNYFLAMDH